MLLYLLSILNPNLDDETDKEKDEEWNYFSIGEDKSLGIKTAGLEDKVTACEM